MTKKVLITALLGVIIITFGYIILKPGDKAVAPTSNNDQPASTSQPESQRTDGGTYIDYSADALQNTSGRKILFFHAPWCPQCRAIESDIIEEGVPEGLTIIKVDYDSNQSLRQKYGVTLQTTFVEVDDRGELVKKHVAYEEPTFEAVKRNFL